MHLSKKFVAVVVLVATVGFGAAAFAATTTKTGKAITAVKVVTETEPFSTNNSAAWVPVPGATTTINVPANTKAILLVRFSAESACYETATVSSWCSLRVMVDGVEADPQVSTTGSSFAFDSPDSGRDGATSWESHSMDRSIVVGAGNRKVTLEARILGTAGTETTFWLDDWSMIVERVKI